MDRRSNKALYGVLFIVCLFFIILIGFATYSVQVFKSESSFLEEGSSKEKIAVIKVNGVIMESEKTIELLHKAEKDESVKAIIMRIDSPGGAVGPTQEIYQEMRRIDGSFKGPESYIKKSKKKDKVVYTHPKPIYASFGSIAASGGYYLGAGAREIYASPGTITGSIGVIMQFADLSKLFEWAKVRQEIVKAGRYKDAGQPSRGLTNEEKDLLNGMIDGVHDQFKRDILNTRGPKLKQSLEELAQGQIFSGEEAKNLGLVDQLGGIHSLGRKIHQALELKGDYRLFEIKEKKRASWMDFVENLEEASTALKLKSWLREAPVLLFK